MVHTMNFSYNILNKKVFQNLLVPVLFEKMKEEIRGIQKNKVDLLLIIGFGGFKTEAGTYVLNFTESVDDLTAFVNCVDPEENCENHKFCADMIIKLLEKGAVESNKTVEQTYVGVTPDNVIYKMNVLKIVLKITP